MGTINQAKRSKRSIVIKIGVAALIFSCIFCLGCSTWFYNLDAPDAKAGSEKAIPILVAIQKYKEKENAYPDYLYELTPEYIPTIPKPDFRHKYCYNRREDGNSFTLAFVPKGEAIGDGWYVYSSELDTWTSVDSDFWGECHFRFDLR
jgi:hypothetical protein